MLHSVMSGLNADRLKLVVIHGGGGTLADAVAQVGSLLRFETRWHDGAFYVTRGVGLVLRQILARPDPDRYLRALQKLILSRFLSACGDGTANQRALDARHSTRFSESRLFEEFQEFGIPFFPPARVRRARQLREEAARELGAVLPLIETIGEALTAPDGRRLSECEAREAVRARVAAAGGDASIPALLESLRDMRETGGDLDTVASAAFYTHWILSAAGREGRRLRYGPDYRYVFVNYHDSLRFLAEHGESDIFMADLPIGALPSFEEDLRYLAGRGVRLRRFEDHHPYTAGQKAMLDRLVADGVVDAVGLSGPIEGKDLDRAEMRCGADMVYLSTVAGHPWDTEGARELRRAAHSEDCCDRRYELGRMLTDLIKGGICKIELVQIMVESMADNDLSGRLRARGWDGLAAFWDKAFHEAEGALLENVHALELRRPASATEADGGHALGMGSDVAAARGGEVRPPDRIRLVVAMAARSEPGKPKLTVPKAVEFYDRRFPDADYLFYCYGASLLVARRLNEADLSLNLGALMPRIGGEGDGGHGGAAVCRPDANPAYPRRLLGTVNAENFSAFVRYLRHRLGEAGHDVVSFSDRSVRSETRLRGGGRQFLIVSFLALLAGLMLALLHPAFRPAAVRHSNVNFLPWSVGEDDEGEGEP